MLEDEVLKWKFRRGSREALARIYEKYLDSMLTLAAGLLDDAAGSQDPAGSVLRVRSGDPLQVGRSRR